MKAIEQFTHAPTETRGQPNWTDCDEAWSDEASKAYKALCYELFEAETWHSVAEVAKVIIQIFEQHPLYEAEEQDILAYIKSEVGLLREADHILTWNNRSNVLSALDPVHVAFATDCGQRSQRASVELKEFEKIVSELDWTQALEVGRRSRGTLEPQPHQLHIEWEAGGSMCSGEGEIPAAAVDPVEYVPVRLRQAWEQILLGTVNAVSAPSHFWDTPFAAPFVALRAPACN